MDFGEFSADGREYILRKLEPPRLVQLRSGYACAPLHQLVPPLPAARRVGHHVPALFQCATELHLTIFCACLYS